MKKTAQRVETLPRQNWLLYEMQSEFCKALSHPLRHAIIQLLKDEEKNVTELSLVLGVNQSNLSQHLAILRDKGIVAARRKGVNVTYSITDPAILKACSIIQKALQERIMRQGESLSVLPAQASLTPSKSFSHSANGKS